LQSSAFLLIPGLVKEKAGFTRLCLNGSMPPSSILTEELASISTLQKYYSNIPGNMIFIKIKYDLCLSGGKGF
jgi:hypothetical protein